MFTLYDKTEKIYFSLKLLDLTEEDPYLTNGDTVWSALYDATHEKERYTIQFNSKVKDLTNKDIYEDDVLKIDAATAEFYNLPEELAVVYKDGTFCLDYLNYPALRDFMRNGKFLGRVIKKIKEGEIRW